jgi:MFS family permease
VTPAPAAGAPVQLGLRANWPQFALLVVVNAFVGGMVGVERAVLPLLAEREFGMASRAAILSFIVSFGVVKALANLVAGRASDRFGRKRLLVAGWLAGLPVPLLVWYAPSWSWVVFANVLLGVNQGLCWSVAVIMKIDLVGPERRGLAMGLNEASGYVAASLAALASGYLAAVYGLRLPLVALGLGFALMGLALSLFFVRESHGHARHEAELVSAAAGSAPTGRQPSFARILLLASWKDRALFAASQAGMVNNLNDGMAWGLFPLLFAAGGLSVEQIGILAAAYPFTWGVLQLATGPLSDRAGRKGMIAGGMIVQAAGIALIAATQGFAAWLAGAVLLGLGTAMVYPTLLAAVSDVAHPDWRASAVGVYRLWRDAGYALGAVLCGIVADRYGMIPAVAAIAGVTLLSGLVAAAVMYETLPSRRVAS